MPATKTLVIRPTDVGTFPLGASSVVADVEVSVSYDRDVAMSDGTFVAGGVPFVATSIPSTGLRVPVVANDDPAITTGDGFSIVVELTYRPRRGLHAKTRCMTRRILIERADPDVIAYGDTKPVRQVPYYMRPSQYVTYLETTLSQAQADRTAARADLEAARTSIAQQASTITGLQGQVSSLSQQLTTSRAQATDLSQQLAAAKQLNATQASTIQTLQSRTSTLTGQLDAAEATISTRDKTITALQAQVAALIKGGNVPPTTTDPTPTPVAVVATDQGGGVLTLSGTGVTESGDLVTLDGPNVSESAGVIMIS